MHAETHTLHHWEPPRPTQASRAIARKSRGHFVVTLTYGEEIDGIGQVMTCESLLEYQVALLLIYRPDFIGIREQVGPFLWRNPARKVSKHTLDFLYQTTSGVAAIVVKPHARSAKPEFQAEMRCLRDALVPIHADKLYVITDRHVDPVALANAELMHATRRPVPSVDKKLGEILQGLDQRTTIGALSQLVDTKGYGFDAVIRALRWGRLSWSGSGRLTLETPVWPIHLDEGAV